MVTEAIGNLKKGAWVQFKPEGRMYTITGFTKTRATIIDGEGNITTIPLHQTVYPLEHNPPTVIPEISPTDKEFASQVAKYVASYPVSTFVRMKPGAMTEDILAIAREKGYEDGPRFKRYFSTPEGQAFYKERYKLELEARRPPPLTSEEKRGVLSEFKELMGREPTPAEMSELYAEELKLKRGVPV